MHWFNILRPRHWVKNLMLLFPPFFGGVLFSSVTTSHIYIPLIAFSLGASGMYILNDIIDLERDKLHHSKKNRPLPSGTISKSSAMRYGIVITICSLILAVQVSWLFLLFLIFYQMLIICYSLWWKQVVILDIFCIATGFLLRLQAGGAAFNVVVSEWLFLTVFFLALFLGAGKRLAEKNTLLNDAPAHRSVLSQYQSGFLESIMFMTGGTVMVTYSIYVIGRPLLIYTVPLCCLGLLRYLHRIWCGQSGDPMEILINDRIMLIISLVWISIISYSIYIR